VISGVNPEDLQKGSWKGRGTGGFLRLRKSWSCEEFKGERAFGRSLFSGVAGGGKWGIRATCRTGGEWGGGGGDS